MQEIIFISEQILKKRKRPPLQLCSWVTGLYSQPNSGKLKLKGKLPAGPIGAKSPADVIHESMRVRTSDNPSRLIIFVIFGLIFATRDEMPEPIFASFKINAHYSTFGGDLWVSKVNVNFLQLLDIKNKNIKHRYNETDSALMG